MSENFFNQIPKREQDYYISEELNELYLLDQKMNELNTQHYQIKYQINQLQAEINYKKNQSNISPKTCLRCTIS